MLDDNASDRVAQALRAVVEAGAPGDRLPSVRDLMAAHRAGPQTVQRAIAALEAEGLVEPVPGRGTFVAERADGGAGGAAAGGAGRRAGGAGGGAAGADGPAEPDLSWQTLALGEAGASAADLHAHLSLSPSGALALSTGYPDEALQPTGLLSAALARAGRRPGAWSRVPPEGIERLRTWFARQAGGRFRPHDVVVTPGAQAGLATTLRVLAPYGAPVVVESPTYLGTVAAARAAGHRVVPVPADRDGVKPDLLRAALRASGAKVVVLQPLYANPTGAILAADRRAAVMEAIVEAGAFLVEDDFSRDLVLGGEPPPPLAADDPDGHVVYLRSLTKSTAPGLRVAAVAARGAAGVRIRAARAVDDFFVAAPLQEAAVEVVSSPALKRHRRSVSLVLRQRRDALVAAVHRHLPGARIDVIPQGGFTLWVRLPDGTDDVALAAEAGRRGVVVSPGRPWFPAEAPAPFLRMTFAGAPVEDLERGVAILGAITASSPPRS